MKNRDEKLAILKQLLEEDRVRMPKKMRLVFSPVRFLFFYGGRGPGKSVSVAKFLLHEAYKRKIRVLCAREIQHSIKDSVHSLLHDLIKELSYTDFIVTDTSIKNSVTGSEFIFSGLFGQDKKQTLKSYANINYCWVEEAQAVSKGSLDVLLPTIREKDSRIIFTFNRMKVFDPVWILQKKIPPDIKVVQKINYMDNPYLPEVLLNQALRDKKRYEQGLDEDYLHIWLGECINISDKSIIKLKDVIDATNRVVSGVGSIEIGADIARYGKDRIVFFKRKGLKVIDYKIYKKKAVDEIVDLLKDFVGDDRTAIIKIDCGYAPGVYDYMKKAEYNVIEINNGSRAKNPDRYNNRISEMWFEFEKIIKEIQLPDIEGLVHELTTREWILDKKSRKIVESKDTYKKREGNESPDLADACHLCFSSEDYVDNIADSVLSGVVKDPEYSDYNLNEWVS